MKKVLNKRKGGGIIEYVMVTVIAVGLVAAGAAIVTNMFNTAKEGTVTTDGNGDVLFTPGTQE